MDIREKIVNELDYNCGGCTMPQTISCTHPCAHQCYFADRILILIKEALPELAKEAGYVKLADCQEPPAVYNMTIEGKWWSGLRNAKREAQQDMLKAGWRKVEVKE